MASTSSAGPSADVASTSNAGQNTNCSSQDVEKSTEDLLEQFKSIFPNCPSDYLEKKAKKLVNDPVKIEIFIDALIENGFEPLDDSDDFFAVVHVKCSWCSAVQEADDLISCPNKHGYCFECVKRTVKQADQAGIYRIYCLLCNTQFDASTLHRVLDKNEFGEWLRKTDLTEINSANIPGLVKCPFCTYAVILDPPTAHDNFLKCMNIPDCGKITCRGCQIEISHGCYCNWSGPTSGPNPTPLHPQLQPQQQQLQQSQFQPLQQPYQQLQQPQVQPQQVQPYQQQLQQPQTQSQQKPMKQPKLKQPTNRKNAAKNQANGRTPKQSPTSSTARQATAPYKTIKNKATTKASTPHSSSSTYPSPSSSWSSYSIPSTSPATASQGTQQYSVTQVPKAPNATAVPMQHLSINPVVSAPTVTQKTDISLSKIFPGQDFVRVNYLPDRRIDANDPLRPHYLEAEMKFLRMKMQNPRAYGKIMIKSIDIVFNRQLDERFEKRRDAFRQNGILDTEILAFHGTPVQNIDSIIRNNLDPRRRKHQVWGPGEYFSEFADVSLQYGRFVGLILFRLLPGNEYVGNDQIPPPGYHCRKVFTKGKNKEGYGHILVVQDPDQYQPYCVYNFA